MADTAHASSRTSSLVQALNAAHVDKDSFVVGMQKSTAPSFRETTEIYSSSEFNTANAVNAGGNISFTFPKTGIVDRCMIRVQLSGMNAANDVSTFEWAQNLACSMVESITLQTHSRLLATIDSYRLAELIEDHPHRDLYQHYGGYDWGNNPAFSQPQYTVQAANGGVIAHFTKDQDALALRITNRAAGTTQTVDVYIPVLLSCFTGQAHVALNTAFTETVQLSVKFRGRPRYLTGTGGLPTGAKFSMICGMQCLEPSVYASTVSKTYKPGKSCQTLWERSTIIARQDVVPPVAEHAITTVRPVSLTSTSVDLARSFSIVAVPTTNFDNATKWSNQFLKIDSVVFEGSGRTLMNCTGPVAAMMGLPVHSSAPGPRQAKKTANGSDIVYVSNNRATTGTLAAATLVNANNGYNAELQIGGTSFSPESNIVNYAFCQDKNDPTYYSQGLSLSGVASQKFTVNVRSRGLPFTVLVISNAVAVKSIAADSGAILNSLSV